MLKHCPMQEYEQFIKNRFGNKILPNTIIQSYLKKAKEKGIILENELQELPPNLNLNQLKEKLTECRRSLFQTSLDSFNCNIELRDADFYESQNKENDHNQNDLKNNKHTSGTRKENMKEKTVFHTIDERDDVNQKEKRLKNILNAYYEYELMKIRNAEKRPKTTLFNKLFLFVIILLLILFIILLIDYFDICNPF